MLDIFVEEDKYLNAKHIQQKWIKIIQVYLLILYTVIFIFLRFGYYKSTELEGEMKFRIAQNHHHHHFICENCGDTKVIDFCPIEQIKQYLPNVAIHTHKLEVYGVCESCQKMLKYRMNYDLNITATLEGCFLFSKT